MFAAGVVAEVRATTGVGATAVQMLGLRDIRSHIAGELPLAECKAALAVATRQYAKRQATWFRRERGFPWMDLSTEPDAVRRLTLLASGRT